MVEKINPGEMGLYKECVPPLQAGVHTISVRQKVQNDTGESYAMPGKKRQRVQVEGPRFVFAPDEIHSLFPPANDCGNFKNRLPQIVLRRRTLPWERNGGTGGEPWLALLLVNEREIATDGLYHTGRVLLHEQCTVAELVERKETPVAQEPAVQPVAARTSSAGGHVLPDYDIPIDLVPDYDLAPVGTIHPPEIETTADERQQSCMAMDIHADLFYKICPRKEELKLLSHVRIVSTEDKELLGQDEDGWFSVVTCNRLPGVNNRQDPETGQVADRLKHRAFLVSLEGHGEILGRRFRNGTVRSDAVGEYDFIRMAVMASWEFTSKNAGDFQTTLTNIGRNGGVGLLGDLRDNCVTVATSATERNTFILETGHVPLSQSYRTGEKGVGLYRGPLTPTPITYEPRICHSADEALVIDPLTGLEQIGYASGFELGRLLGASDETLAVGLMKWRRGDYQKTQAGLDIQDFASRLRLPQIPMDDRWQDVNILDEIFDPLAPLVNPGPDQFLSGNWSDINKIDICGMSAQYTASVRQNIMAETGLAADALDHDSVVDVLAPATMTGEVNSYTFEDAVLGTNEVFNTMEQRLEHVAAAALSDRGVR